MTIDSTSQTTLLGVSIDSSCIRLVQLDDSGSLISSKVTELDLSRSLACQIHELIIEQDRQFGSIGIAVPGMIDLATGIIVESWISELRDLDLLAELGELANGRIIVENDANASAFAEFKMGGGKGIRNMFRVSIGEGIGGGILLDGKLWRGVNGFAGEIGSVVVDDEGTRLEDVASVPNVVRRTRNRFHQDSTSVLNKLEEHEIGLKDILAAAALEDDLALLMLERTGQYIGTAIAAVNNILNVEAVFIGGEITKADGIFLNTIVSRVGECSSQKIFEKLSIRFSSLDGSASAVGAALLAADRT